MPFIFKKDRTFQAKFSQEDGCYRFINYENQEMYCSNCLKKVKLVLRKAFLFADATCFFTECIEMQSHTLNE